MMQSTGEVIQHLFLRCMDQEQFRSRVRVLLMEHDIAVLEPTLSELYRRIELQDKKIRRLSTRTSE
jgi:hypothetical protein